jgi:oxygen-independent coproporphyrinogen-3 oxidase
MRTDAAGIYVHVPFCRRRCHFCSFRITTHRDFEDGWFDGVLTEIDHRAAGWDDLAFDTVYFGGGTPSVVAADRLAAILDRLRERFAIADHSEITVEVNPGDLDVPDLARLRDAGVNRLSIGVQSFDERDLSFLTRHHSGEEGDAAVRHARDAGFECITVDLMYGLPGRSLDRWTEQVERTAALGVEHISAYLLAIEAGTPFGARRKRGAFTGLSEEEERDMFLVTRTLLRDAGYEPYEVSSYARSPEWESRHNRKYWEGAPYLGLGPAAHSYRSPERSWNEAAVRTYAADPTAEAGHETLTEEDVRLERLFLGLRTARGIPRELAGDRTDPIVTEGLAEWRADRLVLTDEGFAVADAIAARL